MPAIVITADRSVELEEKARLKSYSLLRKPIKPGALRALMTNTIGEGVNRIIKIVKNRAGGFRHLKAFSDMIFLTVGDVDIPGQIPQRFRAI